MKFFKRFFGGGSLDTPGCTLPTNSFFSWRLHDDMPRYKMSPMENLPQRKIHALHENTRVFSMSLYTDIYVYYVCIHSLWVFIISSVFGPLEFVSSFVNFMFFYQKKLSHIVNSIAFPAMLFLPVLLRAELLVSIQHFVNEHVGPQVSCHAAGKPRPKIHEHKQSSRDAPVMFWFEPRRKTGEMK